MMQGTRYNFTHCVPIEVSSQTQVTDLTVRVNDTVVFEKQFQPGRIKQQIEFGYHYEDGKKNRFCFVWKGQGKEDEDKHLKIDQIIINGQLLNVHNAEYFPELNSAWYSGLDESQKQMYNARIYGRTGKVFGWFGEVNFYFCTGANYRSRYKYNIENEDMSRIIAEKIDWIYQDKALAKTYHRSQQ